MSDIKMSDEPRKTNLFIFHLFIFHILLTGCGFQPVHQQSSSITQSVDVPVLNGSRSEQLFSTTLDELLNPKSQDGAKRYALDLNFKREETPAIIQQDRAITRYRITLVANYTLKEGDAVITKGNSKLNTSYDDLASDFGSYSAQVDAEERAAKELAQIVYQRLQGFLVR